jgi:hypothetical protein
MKLQVKITQDIAKSLVRMLTDTREEECNLDVRKRFEDMMKETIFGIFFNFRDIQMILEILSWIFTGFWEYMMY